MNLMRIILKNKEKQVFIDEDLTPEEISKKTFEMSWSEAEKYVGQLSVEKKREMNEYAQHNFFKGLISENERCVKEYGESFYEHYNLDHEF